MKKNPARTLGSRKVNSDRPNKRNGKLGKKRIQDVIGGLVGGPQAGPRPVDEIQEREGLVVNDGLMRGAPGAHGGPREREGDGQQVFRRASRKLRSLSVPKVDRRSSPLNHRGKHLRDVTGALKAKPFTSGRGPRRSFQTIDRTAYPRRGLAQIASDHKSN